MSRHGLTTAAHKGRPLDGFELTIDSSGMCKAGFAGDDAPRAVFRKWTPSASPAYERHLRASGASRAPLLTASQLPLSADRATMGTAPFP